MDLVWLNLVVRIRRQKWSRLFPNPHLHQQRIRPPQQKQKINQSRNHQQVMTLTEMTSHCELVLHSNRHQMVRFSSKSQLIFLRPVFVILSLIQIFGQMGWVLRRKNQLPRSVSVISLFPMACIEMLHTMSCFVICVWYLSGRITEEGYKIYTVDELGINPDAGGTDLCPFDCNCCFWEMPRWYVAHAFIQPFTFDLTKYAHPSEIGFAFMGRDTQLHSLTGRNRFVNANR